MDADVIIIGGGLVGATQALALGAHGLSSIVVDSADLEATRAAGFDGRVSAIASASAAMLDAIGLGAVVRDHGCPMLEIRVTDRNRPGFVHFDAAESDGRPLGFMLENRMLRVGLLDALAGCADARLLAPARIETIERGAAAVTVATDRGRFRAPLLIAAEGKHSPLRATAGIRTAGWGYGAEALVTTVAHAVPHGSIAFQIFLKGGPLAILPMLSDADGRHRSAIVWSVEAKEAAGWKSLQPAAFARVLHDLMEGFLGELELLTPVMGWPLRFQRAERLIDHRLALVGDSGHAMHPIAGQGLNVGLRDVAALTEVLVGSARLGLDLGASQVLRRYAAWRASDITAISAATDLLERLFRAPLIGPARRAGLAAVNRIPRLKQAFMAGARGELGARPALLRGELV